VTTEAIGQCDTSLAPCTHESRAAIFAQLGLDDRGHWTSYRELLEVMDRAGIASNVVGIVGHGALRLTAMGAGQPRPATDDEVAAMVRLLHQSLDEGAFGFTTGLEYHRASRPPSMSWRRCVRRWLRSTDCTPPIPATGIGGTS